MGFRPRGRQAAIIMATLMQEPGPIAAPKSRSPGRGVGPVALAVATLVAMAAHGAEPVCRPGENPTSVRRNPVKPAPLQPDAPISVTSDNASLRTSGDSVLQGNVVVRQGDREIRAQDVTYDAAKSAFDVQGSVVYTDPQIRITGGGGQYSAAEGANFTGAEFELRERSARGTADAVRLTPGGVLDLDRVTFSTCPRDDEAWRIRAREIRLDTGNRVGTARNATVEFKDVPIFYMPWASFPLGTQRKSGFLFPSIGTTSKSGAQVTVPWYWNAAPNADVTFEPVWFSRRGIDFAGDARYLLPSQQGRFQFDWLPDDPIANRTRSRFHVEHLARLPAGWRLTVDAANVSDSRWFEDFAQGPEGTSQAFVRRLAALTYRDDHWRLTGLLQHFQTIDRRLGLADRPYAEVPRLIASSDFWVGRSRWLRYGFDAETVNFDRATGVTGWRFDVAPRMQLDWSAPGYFVRPSLAWRFTQYALDHTLPGTEDDPRRQLPVASFDAGLFFERPGEKRRVTLEPRLLYLYAPYRDQSGLPLFDTALPDLNLVQLFRTNRYTGADRVSDANQVSVGLTSRLLETASGRQLVSATVGQAFYFEPPRVRLPGEAASRRAASDLFAQLGITALRNWNVDFGLQWNPQRSESERAQVLLQYRPAPDSVVNVGYRYQRDTLDQAEVSTAWPVSPRWSLYGRYVHSLRDSKPIERFAGLEYRACCWRVRVVGRRAVSSRTGSQDTGIYLQLELAGLASVGSRADTFLESAIRGYSPPPATP